LYGTAVEILSLKCNTVFILAATTHCPADVIFVMDESSSVGEAGWQLMKSSVVHLVGRMDVDSGNTRVGLVCFSDDVHVEHAFNLNEHTTLASIQTAMASHNYTKGITLQHLLDKHDEDLPYNTTYKKLSCCCTVIADHTAYTAYGAPYE